MKQNSTEQYEDISGLYEKIKTDISGYIINKLNWVKLSIYEKIAITSSHLGFIVMVLLLCVSIFFLGVITLGLFLGEWLGSYALGFGMMVLTVLILLLIVLLFGKRVRKIIANIAVMIIKKVESNEE